MVASGGAENCNAVPWGGPWRWNAARVVALLVVVGLVGEAVSRRSHEGARLVAWRLVAHGASNAWAVLGAMSPRACGGVQAFEVARLALLAVGAFDVRTAKAGRLAVVARGDVLRAAVLALRAAGCSREVIAAELVALVRVWSPSTAAQDVSRAMRGRVRR